jgi:hypothetical protein
VQGDVVATCVACSVLIAHQSDHHTWHIVTWGGSGFLTRNVGPGDVGGVLIRDVMRSTVREWVHPPGSMAKLLAGLLIARAFGSLGEPILYDNTAKCW